MSKTLLFDRKIGQEVWSALPAGPGVYRFYCAAGQLIYVGKAKNLRRRLGQYRRAKRLKAHRKMRTILMKAQRLEFTACASELEALELELSTIQSSRPEFNVAGAYSFLYPYLVWHQDGERIFVGYSLKIRDETQHARFGAFRSRLWTREAVESFQFVLGYLTPSERRPFGKRLYRFQSQRECIRWAELGRQFIRGESPEFLSEIAVMLLEKVAARRDAALVQEHLRCLRQFWRQEAKPLAQAVKASKLMEYPIPQADRDRIFLRLRDQSRARSEEVPQRPGRDAPREKLV